MPLTKIGKVSLRNQGGFVTRIMISYLDDDGEKKVTGDCSGDIPLGQERTVDPGNCGVPDGSNIALYAFVVWGTDNEAKRHFEYEKGNLSAKAMELLMELVELGALKLTAAG